MQVDVALVTQRHFEPQFVGFHCLNLPGDALLDLIVVKLLLSGFAWFVGQTEKAFPRRLARPARDAVGPVKIETELERKLKVVHCRGTDLHELRHWLLSFHRVCLLGGQGIERAGHVNRLIRQQVDLELNRLLTSNEPVVWNIFDSPKTG